ncbi:MAG: hypothetical protein ACRBI6_04730, partial [Acidimicrobiales bacterium]
MSRNEITGISGNSRNSFYHAFKYDYLGKIWPDAINKEARLMAMFNKNIGKAEMVGGRWSLTHMTTGLPQSGGMGRPEGADLPLSGRTRGLQPELFPVDLYGTLRVTGQARRAARKKSAVFLNPWKRALKDLRVTWTLNVNRMCHHGPLDILGRITSYVPGTGIVTMTSKNNRTSDLDDRYAFGTKFIRNQMQVAAIAAAGGVVQPLGGPGSGNFSDGQATARYVGSIRVEDSDG